MPSFIFKGVMKMGMLLRRHKNKVAQEELKQVPDEIKEEKKASKTKNKKTSDKG